MTWPVTSFECVCCTTQQRDPTREPDTEFRYIDIASVDKDAKRVVGAQILRGSQAPSRARKEVRAGDVLVSTVRPNLNSVALVPDELDGEIASTGFCVLRANRELVEPNWFFYRCQTPEFVAGLVTQMRGANYPAVSDGVVKSSPLPLPALREQRRILELVEQADALRHQRNEADAVAERIIPAVFRKMFGAPITNPKGWPVQPLGQLVDFVSGATPSKERADYWDGTVPWVSAKDMKRLEITDTIDHISESALRETNIKLITPGAVLIVVRGMILAHTVPIALNRAPLTINQDMKALVPAGDVPVEFLQWALLSQHQNLLRLVSTAAHGTRKLDTDALTALQIPVPTALLEQFARYTREQSLARECRRSAAEKIETLFAVMLHRAFNGELTARWREAHMKELLTEMEQQVRCLNTNGATL